MVLTLVGWTSVSSANPLYAYVKIPFNDGTTKYDYYCLLWKTEWPVVVTMTHTYEDGPALKYTANSSSRVFHIFAMRHLNQNRWVPLDLYVRMYDQPQPGWDCTPQMWSKVLNEPPHHFVYHPPTDGGGGESQGSWGGIKDYRCGRGTFSVDNPGICGNY
jgi:hypothetical protein